MVEIWRFLTSTVGRKYLTALSGLVWSGFVLSHMLGNLLIFAGAEAYNKYSYALSSNPLVYGAELFLLVALILHIVTAVSLKIRNLRSKPSLYAVKPTAPKGTALSSRTMIYTGSAVLAFLIWHLATFKWGPEYLVTYDGVQMRDLYTLVNERFHETIYVGLYCISMIFIGVHLFHGVKSSFQSLGINHPRYNNFLRYFGYIYAVVVAAGFVSQPVYVFFLR